MAVLVGPMLALIGCTTAPAVPTAALDEALRAIQTAESDEAGQYAAAELDRARQSPAQANRAARLEDMILARRLADEATVTARLASARTEAAKAAAINEELIRSSNAMLEEIRRAGDRR